MLIHIQNLVADTKCYEVVRQLRWPRSPSGGSIRTRQNASGMSARPASGSLMI